MFTDKHWLPEHTMQLEVETSLGWLAIDVTYSRTDEVDDYAIDIRDVDYNGIDINGLFSVEALEDAIAEYEHNGR